LASGSDDSGGSGGGRFAAAVTPQSPLLKPRFLIPDRRCFPSVTEKIMFLY